MFFFFFFYLCVLGGSKKKTRSKVFVRGAKEKDGGKWEGRVRNKFWSGDSHQPADLGRTEQVLGSDGC